MVNFIMGDEAMYKGQGVVLAQVRNKDVLLAYTEIVGPNAGGKTVSVTHSEVERVIDKGELKVL